MKESRRKLEEILWITGLHHPARSLYAATLGRQSAKAQQKMQDFYRQVVQPGSLVFDIGANVGVVASTFASLGAKVVAVEPNSDCVRHLQLSYPERNINVVQAAVGAENGLVILNVADGRDVRSSVSDEWVATMSARDETYRDIWTRQIVVPMVTLDSLIKHFGMPHYIKIDVEGFEENVLCGLCLQPQLLSFEFTAAFLPSALRCLRMSIFRHSSTFNFAYNAGDWGYPEHFERERWLGKEEMEEALMGFAGSDKQGDIFVRAPH